MLEKIIINDYIQGDPLSEDNLDETFALTNKICLSLPNKPIWIYTKYHFESIFNRGVYLTRECSGWKRREILKNCTVMVDGEDTHKRIIDLNKSVFMDEVYLI